MLRVRSIEHPICFDLPATESKVYNVVRDPVNRKLFKGSIFPPKQTFYIQERFNKLIYRINTIIKCGI